MLGGVFLMMNPSFLGSAVGIVAGVALIIYGVSELLSSWKMRKAIDEYEIKFPSGKDQKKDNPVHDVKDVDYEKVDEQ